MGTVHRGAEHAAIRQRDGRHQLEQHGRDRIPVPSLTFTTTNWNVRVSTQTVTVTAGQDPDAANDMATLTHNPSGADYDSVSNASLTVTVTDDDTRGVTVSRTSLTIDRGRLRDVTVETEHAAIRRRDGHRQ